MKNKSIKHYFLIIWRGGKIVFSHYRQTIFSFCRYKVKQMVYWTSHKIRFWGIRKVEKWQFWSRKKTKMNNLFLESQYFLTLKIKAVFSDDSLILMVLVFWWNVPKKIIIIITLNLCKWNFKIKYEIWVRIVLRRIIVFSYLGQTFLPK